MEKKKVCPLCFEEEVGKDTNGLCLSCYQSIKNEEEILQDFDLDKCLVASSCFNGVFSKEEGACDSQDCRDNCKACIKYSEYEPMYFGEED